MESWKSCSGNRNETVGSLSYELLGILMSLGLLELAIG